jgi:hypothetical protein
MIASVTVDGVTLYELRVFTDISGEQYANAVYSLTSGGQPVVTVNQVVTSMLSASQLAAVTTAFNAVQAAIALAPLPQASSVPTGTPTRTGTPSSQATSTPTPTSTATP